MTKQRQWAAFLKKNRLEAPDLADVVELLRSKFQQLEVNQYDFREMLASRSNCLRGLAKCRTT